MTATKTSPAFVVTTTVSDALIASTLCSAFEGGVGYWCQIHDYVRPAAPVGHLEGMEDEVFSHVDFPLCPDGAVLCRAIDEHTLAEVEEDPSLLLQLDRQALDRGLALMPVKSPKQWGHMLSGNGDADTGDTFVQLCLFGEVRYG
jgi:hypothetical protein